MPKMRRRLKIKTQPRFIDLVEAIPEIGLDWHKTALIENTRKNRPYVDSSIDELREKQNPNNAIVVSAGPSLHQVESLEVLSKSEFDGVIIAIDGSYIKCLKAGIVPDYVVTLDPHPSRIVRWFGDPHFRQNKVGDDYFDRQDLDIAFRRNSEKENDANIELVNRNASRTKLVISCTAPTNVVERAKQAGFLLYWWTPLVDDPDESASLTRKIYGISRVPAMNTGGNVGTAAWIFAKFWLQIEKVAVIGMDLGYYFNVPYSMTQTYYELMALLGDECLNEEYFPKYVFPLTGDKFYIDPTYYWYRKNLLSILSNTSSTIINCTGAGTLFGKNVICINLQEFINDQAE